MSEETIFTEALQRATGAERKAYLDDVCQGNVALREQVEALLKSHLDGGSFLGQPLPERLAEQLVMLEAVEETKGEHSPGGNGQALRFLTPSDKPDTLGRLGHYEVQEIIGHGGMGIVLRAFDEKLHRVVAIKVMTAPLATNATARKRFTREARAAAAVSHDHVVTIHGVEEASGLPYLVMQYVSGVSLQERIDRSGPLQLHEILRIGMQAATGLAAAHAQGLVHRDIKPANILLENGVERVKITDFGLAHAVDDVRTTQPGAVIGTPEYMSPEQARGEGVDHRSDLFSLGCVLYAMCAGRPPFRAESTVAIIRRVCEDTPRPLSEINSEIPGWLTDLIDKLIAKDASERFQSAAEVAELLSQYLAYVQQPAVHSQPAAIAKPRPVCRQTKANARRRWSLAAAAVLLLCAGLSLAESTGVTNVAATVIRIVRGDGTLVVEIDDPNIQILIDGEEVVISGAGPKEIRLRPGQHELHTLKDGKPVETKLVTISRDGREVVKVAREAALATVQAAPTTRLVWDDATDTTGGPSLDGRYFTFVDWETGDVAVRDLVTGKNRRLTNKGPWDKSGEFALYPILSADGTFVVYTWFDNDGKSDLRRVSSDGGAPRRLYTDASGQRSPSPFGITPDGKFVFAHLEGNDDRQIALIAVSDGSVRVLKSLETRGTRASLPKVSFDGRYAAYARRAEAESANTDLFLIDTATERELRMTVHPANKYVLGWAPDGQRLLFGQEREGGWDAWMIRVVDGQTRGRPELVKRDIGYIVPFHFTRDGALFYGQQSGGPSLLTGTLDIERGTATAMPLAAEEYNVTDQLSGGHWSPDGEHLAYKAVVPNRGQEIRIVSLKTGQTRVLKPDLYSIRRLQWSPDAKFLLTAGSRKRGLRGINQIDTNTGEVTPLVETSEWEPVLSAPVWAPDQSGVYYVKGNGIVYRDLQAQTEREILARGNSVFDPWHLDVSPDGRQLAAVGKDRIAGVTSIKLIPVDGKSPQDLVQFGTESIIRTAEWTPDGQYVVFSRLDENAKGLWYVSAKGGEPRRIQLSGTDADSFQTAEIHPDGKQLALNKAGARKSQLWALENFLPPLADSNTAAAASAGSAAAAVSAREQPSATEPTTRRVWAKAVDLRYSGTASPDGKYVSFIDMPSHNVAVYELDTGKTRRLSNEGGSEMGGSPIFSPDGQQVAYRWTNKEKVNELRTVGIDGSQPRVLYPNTDQSITNLQPCDWSADGKSILAVFATKAGNQLVLVSVADGSVRVLKESASSFHVVVTPFPETTCLSPDGRYVAYSAAPQSTSHQRDLFLLATDGSGEVPLVEHPADDFVLGWSPDGKRLVFASDRMGSTGIWLIEVAEGKPQGTAELVKPAMGQFRAMRLTRAGSLFYGVGTGGGDVYTATLDLEQGKLLSRPVQAMQRSEGSNHNSAWSPDGRYLACTSHRQSRAPLVYIRSLESNEVRELAPDLLRFGDTSIEWSPDGRELLSLGENRDGKRGTQRLDVQTGAVTSIPANGPRLFPALSPDGKSLFYLSQYSGRPEKPGHIQRRDLETGVEHDVHQISDFVMNLTLSPDGQQLAFTEKGSVLKVLPTAGGQPRELAKAGGTTYLELLKGEGHIITVAWTPDGRHLIYQKIIPQPLSMLAKRVVGSGPDPADLKTELWRVPVVGGPPQQLDVALPLMIHLRIHPDGRQITFSGQPAQTVKNEIWVLENFLPPLADSKPPAAADASAAQSR